MHGLRGTFVLVAITLCVLPLIVSVPLLDPDEGLHAAIAQEMVLRHDYLTPTFLGEPFLDKPVLFFWAEAFSIRALGMHESAVRLPALLFGTLGMLSVALLAGAMFGSTVGLVTGIVYGTMMLPVAVSNVTVHDIALVPFMCCAALCLWRAAGSTRAWAWGIPVGVCLGLSILTKGLAGAVFAGIFAMCLAARQPSALARLVTALTIGGAIAILVAAPWYIAMERAHPGYLHYYFIERHLRGYLTATQRHAGRPWWYYVPIVVGGALPWTGYLVRAARGVRPAGRTSVIWVAWMWLAIGLVFLTIGESKLATYALPIFPPLAMAIAYDVVSQGRSRAGVLVQIATLAGLPLASVIAARLLLEAPIGLTWIIPFVALAIVLFLARGALRATSLDAAVRSGAVMALVSFAGVMLAPLPHAARYLTSRDLAAALNTSDRLPSRVMVVDERIGSLIFYLSPTLRAQATPDRIQGTSLSSAIDRARIDSPDAVLAVRDDQQPRFARLFADPPEPFGRAGTFSLYRADLLREAIAKGGR